MEHTTCPGKIKVPSEEEVIILSKMRDLKSKAHTMKEQLASLTTASCDGEASEKIQEMEQELARLRTEWNRLDEKRKEAAKERMIALGHERA